MCYIDGQKNKYSVWNDNGLQKFDWQFRYRNRAQALEIIDVTAENIYLLVKLSM
jgi:hypothetical protein